MAKIALDGRKYFDFGIGTYLQQLTRAISELGSSHQFILFAESKDLEKINLDAQWEKLPVDYKKYSLEEIFSFQKDIRKASVDLFHEPHYTLPVGLKKKSVVTIHDLIHLRFPAYHNLARRTYARWMIHHAVHHSGAIIVNSEFTKQEILDTFIVEPSKIHVTYFAVGGEFAPVKDESRKIEFRKRYSIERPYIFYVGSMKPHKNIPLLLRTFAAIRKRIDVDLVLAGEKLFENIKFAEQARALNVAAFINDLGALSPNDLVTAYSCAEVFAFPSQYEGFGFPLLEAMACGTPVVASDGGALQEISGNAALHFPSGLQEAFENNLSNVLTHGALRQELISRGLNNVRRFSWHVAAQKTLQIYESLL